jgi:hypothetical protein
MDALGLIAFAIWFNMLAKDVMTAPPKEAPSFVHARRMCKRLPGDAS